MTNLVAHVGRRQAETLEHRIAEDLQEVRHQTLVLTARERFQVAVEFLGKPEEDLGAQRSLVMFDQVEVAGRYAEALGHLRLTQPFAPPEPPDPRAQPQPILDHRLPPAFIVISLQIFASIFTTCIRFNSLSFRFLLLNWRVKP